MSFIKKIFNTKSLKINTIFNAFYQILALIVPLISAPYISRVLGPANNGLYSFYYSIVTYFILIATFGFNEFGTKYIAEVRDDKTEKSSRFWSIMISKLIFGGFIILIYFIFVFTLYSSDINALFILLLLSFNIFASTVDPTFYFQGDERFVSISIRNMITRIVTLILIITLVNDENDLLIYTAIVSVGQFISTIVLYFSFKKKEIVFVKPSKNNILSSTRKAFAFFLPSLAVTLFYSLNQTLLGAFGYKEDESGYYGQAVKILSLLSALTGSISIIILSRFSYLNKTKNDDEIRNKTKKLFEMFWALSLPIVFGIYAVSHVFIPFFLGSEYSKSVYCMYFMAPVIILSPLNGLYGNIYYRPNDKIYIQTIIIFSASIINIISCCIFIPLYQSIGASIGRLLAEFFQLPFLILFSIKYIGIKTVFKPIIKPLISSTVMLVITLVIINIMEKIANNFITLSVSIFSGAFVYYVLELIIRDKFVYEITKNFLKRIIKKK